MRNRLKILCHILLLSLPLKVMAFAEPNAEPNLNTSRPKPMIIWFHNCKAPTESLKLALSSDLISHVMILDMHRADADWKNDKEVIKAVGVVKQSGAKLIWCRDLWPYYALGKHTAEDFFDPNYYIGEIRALRTEANEIGADYTALDAEPYGNAPAKQFVKSGRHLSTAQSARHKAAIQKAIAAAGKVDFILPAGSLDLENPYIVLATLGENRIAENTYFNNETTIKNIKYPYEIFAAFLNTTRNRPESPSSPHFLAGDIFDKSELWSSKKGLLLFVQSKQATAIAKQLVEYSKSLKNK